MSVTKCLKILFVIELGMLAAVTVWWFICWAFGVPHSVVDEGVMLLGVYAAYSLLAKKEGAIMRMHERNGNLASLCVFLAVTLCVLGGGVFITNLRTLYPGSLAYPLGSLYYLGVTLVGLIVVDKVDVMRLIRKIRPRQYCLS